MTALRRLAIPVADAALGAVLAPGPAAAAARRAHTLRVASAVLRRCTAAHDASIESRPGWCGSIRRALDPGLRGGPTIPIGFV